MFNIIFLHKISRWFYLNKIKLISKLIEILIFLIFNSRISSNIKIGKGTKFYYRGLSVLLVSGTEIGKNCAIGMRFTTGRLFPYKDLPKIGDNVFLGTNSVVLGPVIIEDNVIIAPNTVVRKSIPKNSIVAGNPAKIIGSTLDLDYNIFNNEQYKEGKMPYMKLKK